MTPYGRKMAGSGTAHLRTRGSALLVVEGLVVEYRVGRHQRLRAVADVSFDVMSGEALGIVGESGCGKSSTGRAIMQLPPPTRGHVTLQGRELMGLGAEELREQRAHMQMIFQDPRSSLNPRRRIWDIVSEPRSIWGDQLGGEARVSDCLREVGLDPERVRDRYPGELSGGQNQRVAIARALMMGPRLLVCDEPVSALDVSVQAKILNLLEDLRERRDLTLVFISHDLSVIKSVSDRVVVMYLGKVCEVASTAQLFSAPAHPYTVTLLDSIPVVGKFAVGGRSGKDAAEIPSALNPPSGCRFRTRCPRADGQCVEEEPVVRQVADDQFVACHHPISGGPASVDAQRNAIHVPEDRDA